MESKSHPYGWAVEPLADKAAFVARPMFGAMGCYYNGLLMLVLTAREEPWRGILVATERDQHAALLADFPHLAPHEILPKWLYLPETNDLFEATAARLVELILDGDPRIGVVPKKKKKKRKSPSKDGRPPHLE